MLVSELVTADSKQHISTIRLYSAIHCMVHTGKYGTEDKSKTDSTKTNTTQKSKQHK